jgi:8-oxo-dGTP diphosphatase
MPLHRLFERIALLAALCYAGYMHAHKGDAAPPPPSASALLPSSAATLCSRDFAQPNKRGSCLCGNLDDFCLCTPSIAVDCIIELSSSSADAKHAAKRPAKRYVFAERRDGRGLAIVGGFLRVGESAEDGVRREVKEETGLELGHIEQWCVFSAPGRDERRHTATLVFVGRAHGEPRAGDDARGVRTLTAAEMATAKFAFDHASIVNAYAVEYLGRAPRVVTGDDPLAACRRNARRALKAG